MEKSEFINNLQLFFSLSPAVEPFRQVHLIVNPAAGGFRKKNSLHTSNTRLLQAIKNLPPRNRDLPVNRIEVHVTGKKGDAHRIAADIIAGNKDAEKILFITAGGDGTGTETVSALYESLHSNMETMSLYAVFRMPFGTGNDGLDAFSMEEAYSMFGGAFRRRMIPVLEIKLNNGPVYHAANIASFGFDAYVTERSNSLKEKVPGSFYTVMADLAALFYERKVELRPYYFEYTDRDGRKQEYREKTMLIAAGVSGYRTYGKGKRVLPGEENICIIKPMKLFRKFAIKEMFYRGSHTEEPETMMISSDSFRLDYDERLPFQYDGESMWLPRESFPLTCRIIRDAVPVLVPEKAPTSR